MNSVGRCVLVATIAVGSLTPAGAWTITDGYYAGTTSEGLGFGLRVSSSGSTQDRIKVKARLYNGYGVYVKDTTFEQTRSAAITSKAFSNVALNDTTTTGGGTPRWSASGIFNEQLYCTRPPSSTCSFIYSNTTGSYNWSHNYPTSDPLQRRTSEDLTYTVTYLGTSTTGTGPASISAWGASSSSIGVSWSPTPGATRYGLERSTSPTTGYTVFSYPTAESDTITGLSANTTYYVRVRAENIWGWTSYSGYTSALTAPPAPTGVNASVQSSSTIRVTWSVTPGAASYRVLRSTSAFGIYSSVDTVTTTQCDNTGLSAATTYYYKIVAVNASGTASGLSSYTSATTAPLPPGGVTATALSPSSIQLSWTASPGATGYYLYRSVSSATGYSYIGYSAGTTYTNSSGLSSGTRYYYRIRAYLTAYSDSSAPVSAITYPAAPAGVSASPGASGGVNVTWSTSNGAVDYEISRSASSGGTYTALGTVSVTSYHDAGAGAGSTWYYKLRARNASGWSVYSAFAAVTLPPASPSSVVVSAVSTSSLHIAWSSSAGATSYTVYVSADSLGSYTARATTALTSMTDTDLKAAQKYYYNVVASNSGGSSPASVPAAGTTLCLAPAAPALVTVSTSRIDVAWTAVTGATGYTVYRATSSAGPYSSIGQTASLTLSSTSLLSGRLYYYKVSARNAGGESALSAYASAQTIPSAPTAVSAGVSGTTITISWSPPTGASSYTVFRSVSSGGTYDSIGSTTGYSYDDTGLPPSTTRYYRVSARNSGGESSQSSYVSATTAPATPAGLNAAAQSSSEIALGWSASAGASSYSVYRSGSADSLGSLLGSTAAVSYIATGLMANTAYYFRVSALSASGSSGYSNAVGATTAPAIPAGLSVSAVSSSALNVTWSCSPGATEYRIYRSLSGAGPFISIGTSAACSYADHSLSDATTYYYTVSARSAHGQSVQSAPASASTMAQAVLSMSISSISVGAITGSSPNEIVFSITNTGSGSMSYTVSRAQGWLSVSPASGESSGESDPVTVSFAASGLSAGVYRDTIVVTASGATGNPGRIPVQLTISAAPMPLVGLNTSALSVSARVGTSPSSRILLVRNSGTGTLSYSVSSNQTWLTTSPSGGSSTGEYDTITLAFATAALGVGSYGATVTVTDAGASNSPQALAVTLTVEPAPQAVMIVSPAALTPAAQQGVNPVGGAVRVWNSGDTTLYYSAAVSQSWLSVSPLSGSCNADIDTLTVTYATSALAPGSYSAAIILTDQSGASAPETVTVSLSVTAAAVPVISVSPRTLYFSCTVGAAPASDSVRVWNAGTGVLAYSVSASHGWLSVSPSHDTSRGEMDNLLVSCNASSLDTGSYAGVLVVTDVSGGAPPETVTVTLRVDPAPAAVIGLSRHDLSLSAATGTSSVPAMVTVWNAGDSTLNYRAVSEHGWCVVTPATGSSDGEQDTLTIAGNASALAPGSYTCVIVFEDIQGVAAPETLTVRFDVTATPAADIVLDPTTLHVTSQAGTAPAPVSFRIHNVGSAPLHWLLSVNQTWLSAGALSGTMSPGGSDTVEIQFNAAGLDTGTWTARVVVSDTGRSTDPETLTVALRITPAPSPVISILPGALVRSCAYGVSLSPDTIAINNTGGAELTYAVSVSVPWITVAPDSGRCGTGEQVGAYISYATGQLDTGVHTAHVIVRNTVDTAMRAESLTVSLTVIAARAPQALVSPASLNLRAYAGDSLVRASFALTNVGGDTLRYRVRSSQPWLVIDSSHAAVSTETDSIPFTIMVWSLDTGYYQAHAVVEHIDGSAATDTCLVELLVTPAPVVAFVRTFGAGDTVYSGSIRTISWTTRGDFAVARLSWSTDNGATWAIIDDSLHVTDPFAWRVPDTSLADVRLRIEVMGVSDTAVAEMPDGFTIRINHAPVISLPDTFYVTHTENVVMNILVSDSDGDSVTLFLSALPAWAKIKAGSGGWAITFEALAGDTPVALTVTAVDIHGLLDTHTVVLAVDLTSILALRQARLPVDDVRSVRLANGTLHISYGIGSAQGVRIELYTVAGRHIASLPLSREIGWHQMQWHGRLSAGVYLLRAHIGDKVRTLRLIAPR